MGAPTTRRSPALVSNRVELQANPSASSNQVKPPRAILAAPAFDIPTQRFPLRSSASDAASWKLKPCGFAYARNPKSPLANGTNRIRPPALAAHKLPSDD